MQKLFFTILFILIALSFYIKFTQPEEQSERPVIYWKSDPNPQRYEQIKMFHAWLVKHGYVDKKGRPVVELRLDSANTQSKLIQAVSGVGGDLIDCPIEKFQGMGLLTDLTEYGKELGFGADYSYPGVRQLLEVNGRLYGYPCNGSVAGLWINVDTFRKYGMDAPPEIWDPDTFEKIGKEFVTRANKGQKRRTVFFAENPCGGAGSRFRISMYRSYGLDIFNETLTRSQINDPRYIAVIKLLYKWTFTDHLFPSAAEQSSMSAESGYGGNKLSHLQYGKYGMIMIGRYCLIRIRTFKNPPRLSVSRFPLGEFQNMVIAVRAAGLYRGSKNKEYAKLFFAFLADKEYNDYIVTDADGLPPNPKYAYGNPVFEKPVAHPNEGTCSAVELGWARTIALPMTSSPYYNSEGINWMKYGLDMVFNNKGTPEEAAKEVEDRMNNAIHLTIDKNPDLKKQYEQDVKLQQKIDEYKKAGKKIPARWIKNPFYLRYYKSKGMLSREQV